MRAFLLGLRRIVHFTAGDRYIAINILRAFCLVALALTALFSLLEFVQQLSNVGEGNYTLWGAMRYVALTAPQRLLEISPVSMLLGTLLSLGGLARSSELTGMRAIGVSEYHIVGIGIRLAVPIMLVLFVMAQFVIPVAQQSAQDGRAAAIAADPMLRSRESFWAYGERQYLNVQSFGKNHTAYDVEIYTFAPDGALASYIRAKQAVITSGDLWVLSDVQRKRLYGAQFQTDTLDSLDWHAFLTAKHLQLLRLPMDSMPPLDLLHYIHTLKRHDQESSRFEQALWSKINIPVAMIAMIMVAAPFVFGNPRSQNTGAQIAIGTGFGVVFSLAQQIVAHLGLLLGLNQGATILGPSILLMLIAARLMRRTY